MPIDVPLLAAFNRGIISKLALARVDVERVALSADEQTNWMPRVMGSMTLRPGLAYRGSTRGDNPAVHIPFVFSNTDTAIIELTPGFMRVRRGDDDAVISRLIPTTLSVPESETLITNGSFAADLTGWTDADDAGATSAWVTGGFLGLTGTGFNYARRRQQVTYVARADQDYAVRVVVERGPVTIRIGTTAGADDIGPDTALGTGVHSLSFTPGGNFWVELSAVERYTALVASIEMEPRQEMALPTPWGAGDLPFVRFDQSRDVVFVACKGKPPYRIERRGLRSWGLAKFEPAAGPFRIENVGPTAITPSALTGNITLTASQPLFRAGHVGALFRLTSFGQKVEATFSGEDQFSDPIRVTGVGASQRRFTHTLTGMGGTGTTVTLQRSVGDVGAWLDVSSFDSNGTRNYNDGLDNQIIFYRLGVKTGDYSTGTISLSIEYASSGTITGTARVTAVASTTSASAIVLKALGGTDGTTTWSEGLWSGLSGYPTAVGFYEGRLWWFGQDRIIGSASDAFDDYDETEEGDGASISRTIGAGPTEEIAWMLPLQRLLIGGQGAAFSARSSSLDEPLTPSAFSLKVVSTQGAAAVAPARVDTSGYYVQASGKRLHELGISEVRFDYEDSDVTALVPEIGEPSILQLAVQRQPDTRLHCVRSDGKVAVFVTDRAEQVRCWVLVEPAAGGIVEGAFVLPGAGEDRVYYLVKRIIGGATKRYLERWATEDKTTGGAITALCDSHVEYSGIATNIVFLPHLEGQKVVVWANNNSVNNADGTVREFTVSGNTITLPSTATNIVVGLAYKARFKSTKLAYAAPVGTALNMRKRVARIGLIMANVHHKGLMYGQSFDVMDELPQVEKGAVVADGTIWDHYDEDDFSFPGEWNSDSRICLEASSPRPATVLAASFIIEGHRGF